MTNILLLPAVAFSLAAFAETECLAQARSYDESCRTSDSLGTLCETEARLTHALQHNDATALGDIYADDFRLINYRGTIVGKTGVLDAIRSGSLRFDALTSSELEVRAYGDVGIVTGRQRQVAREPGADDQAHPADVRFTHIFVRTLKTWRLLASQITPVLSTRSP